MSDLLMTLRLKDANEEGYLAFLRELDNFTYSVLSKHGMDVEIEDEDWR